MPIRNSHEFLEALRKEARKYGYESSATTEVEEVETKDSSDSISIGVVMNPRLPQRKDEAPQG